MKETKRLKNFDKEKQRREKEQKGITLIALVITIIVLLILAGVSIATLTGENGILTKANQAKEETEIASEQEQRQMAMLNATMHDELWYYKEGVGELTSESEIKEGEKLKDGVIPIPAGFAPTGIEGENLTKDGFVITDSEGNEFVWIPCKYENTDAGDEVVYNQGGNNADSRDEAWKDAKYQSSYNGGIWYDAQPHNEGMKSVKTYGGFYVARYEAGVPENAPFYASKQGDTYVMGSITIGLKNNGKDISEYIPVSKKGQQVWNCISQTNAKTVSEKMVDNKSVKSYLIDSHAWNTVCRVMKQKEGLKDEDLTNSIKWGNYYNNTTTKYEKIKGLWAKYVQNEEEYKDCQPAKIYNYGLIQKGVAPQGKGENRIEIATGLSDDFKVYNIYDMAGNVWEMTTEKGNRDSNMTTSNHDEEPSEEIISPNMVVRGGSFYDKEDESVVYVSCTPSTGTFHHIGFRVVLYLQ